MGQRIYFRHRLMGASVRSMDIRGSRGGSGRFLGLGKSAAHMESTSPNFEREVTVLVPFYGTGWTQKDLHEAIDDLAEGLITDAAAHGYGCLAWVKDDTHTGTNYNAETAGTGVSVEFTDGQVAALDIAEDDWVLCIDSTNDVGFLSEVGTITPGGGGFTSVLLDLPVNIANASTFFKVWKGIDGCVFETWDPGQPDEQSLDNVRPITTWRFSTPNAPVRSADV